jgi:hypothetical protein
MKSRFKELLQLLPLLGFFFVGNAFAELVFVTNIQVFGTGLGAVNTLVTVHDPGGPGNQNNIESGCINSDGSFSPCLGTVQGGDNTAINQVLSFDNDFNYAAVVNIAETGQDLTVTLTDLYLVFEGDNGTHTAFYTGPDIDLTQGTGTGLGGSGFTFALDDAEFAIVSALGDTVTVWGGVQFAEGTTNDGNDTVHVIQFEGETQVPEPSTLLLLLGSGLVSIGVMARRRARRQK